MPANPGSAKRPAPRGRPRTLDRAAALDRAVDVFWAKGFDGASLDDLTGAMKLSRPSLYAMFGDKAGLFNAAIDAYAAGIGSEAVEAFAAEDDIDAAVATFLRTSLINNTSDEHPPGCLIGCCASMSATQMPDVGAKIRAMLRATTTRLAERFERETTRGTLGTDPSPSRRAALLVDLMYAQSVRARAGAPRTELLGELDARVGLVIA